MTTSPEEDDPKFAEEIPTFVDEIRRVFAAPEIRGYLDHLERTTFLAPSDSAVDLDDLDDEIED